MTTVTGSRIGLRVKLTMVGLAVLLLAVATPAGDNVRWWATETFFLDEHERIADVEVAWTPTPEEAAQVDPDAMQLPAVHIQVLFEPAVDGGNAVELDDISPNVTHRIVTVGTRILVYADSSPDRVGAFTCTVRIHWKDQHYLLPMAHTSAFPNMHGRWVGTVK